ncbi:MAG: hypothetical protein ACJAZM_000734 [Cyclobacteriaceae bacterium]
MASVASDRARPFQDNFLPRINQKQSKGLKKMSSKNKPKTTAFGKILNDTQVLALMITTLGLFCFQTI